MIYFDTNVLVYSVINQDADKMLISQKLIKQAIENNEFIISPLVIQELIFVLSKLKIENSQIDFIAKTFMEFVVGNIDKAIVRQAAETTTKYNLGKNINDIIHLRMAEKHAQEIVTFDEDFLKLKNLTTLNIKKLY